MSDRRTDLITEDTLTPPPPVPISRMREPEYRRLINHFLWLVIDEAERLRQFGQQELEYVGDRQVAWGPWSQGDCARVLLLARRRTHRPVQRLLRWRRRTNMIEPYRDGFYACPCCASLTLDERGGYDVCPVCFWEDDGQDDHDADGFRGGPNRSLSLTEARRNYTELGACHREFLTSVRPPTADEQPHL